MKKYITLILMVAVCICALSGCTETKTDANIDSVDGIKVVSGTFEKPKQGEMNYAPVDESAFFAVDNEIIVKGTLTISDNTNGILHYNLAMKLDSAMEVEAKIQVFKDGEELAVYVDKSLSLPAGETVLNACVDTKESAPCSGEYMVRVYINGSLISEDTGTV